MISKILDKAVSGQRISFQEGLALLESNELAAIGSAADAVCRTKHPEPYRTYNIDRNINYTNICTAVCDFCAFYRSPKSNEGYVLSREELLTKIAETIELGGEQICYKVVFTRILRSTGTKRCFATSSRIIRKSTSTASAPGATSLHEGE